jgi:hypothetical protein
MTKNTATLVDREEAAYEAEDSWVSLGDAALKVIERTAHRMRARLQVHRDASDETIELDGFQTIASLRAMARFCQVNDDGRLSARQRTFIANVTQRDQFGHLSSKQKRYLKHLYVLLRQESGR